ncbi:NADH dehydrogenase subunit J [Thermodesulfitimonas autotrophica]|uniref:NADH-quinone oxidoreductase subunit J n=1 Tax=Thermodesulfitimonas autotrophica TaxID=1894989 RepID=A0A3N5ACC8_9THEO|nr:NADH-quinone oxidoreductase subunit J [Thermodesulfitimonas autotrophica]RPF42516.1 NADH dehydrogenase subunit J [Thermodesulfitimonas autotrophica]
MVDGQLGSYVAFAALTVLVLGGGLGVVFLRNIFHAAVAMVVCFLGVAGVYFTLQANFLAVMQVLIYVGAVAVVIAFAIMLTRRGRMVDSNRFVGNLPQLVIGTLVAAALGVILVGLGCQKPWRISDQAPVTDITRYLGEAMLSKLAVPFEIAAVLLLVALVGAVMIALEEVRKS